MIGISLPWPPQRLSPNWTGKLQAKIRAKRHYRRACQHITAAQMTPEIRQQIAGFGDRPLHLEIRFYPPAGYLYDRDNLVARMKNGIDGACLELGIDDRRFRVGTEGIYGKVENGQVDLIISELPVSGDPQPLPRPWE